MKREPHDGSIRCVRFSIVATAECDSIVAAVSGRRMRQACDCNLGARERHYSASQLSRLTTKFSRPDCVSSRNTVITVIPAVRIG